ncbi:uncharacterized protein LOC116418274 [Nasonia vitripennis]|uniref:Integrase catalytic domain-containing protein n=1 Tax=Nasonia vitripennis TaxID=7425 RepID=A0A7M7QQ58_NASVI|nr:uncharacterized protein LOC116417088 [Nasonia vitripennis]XP_031789125.1 uncharacterized protein LOC116418127 [Nasonia vitripennis]XP_031789174.1 uncharacterized protein LOC116418274 [Nasonia vitripennis]
MVKSAGTKFEKKYYDPGHEAGYAGARNLLRVNTRGKSLTDKEKNRIYEWLSNQDTYTLHHPICKKFSRLHYNVTNIDDVWEAELCQLTALKEANDGFCYILVVIDVLSKFVWAEPLRDKSAQTVATAIEKILKRAGNRVPQCLQSDKGKEFTGSAVQKILKKYDISFRTARNPGIKAAVVKRKIVDAYNNTIHTSTNMRPAAVNLYNAHKARSNVEQQCHAREKKHPIQPKYRVNYYVRIS